ncbi:MAG: tRNA (adenosine(37)-N6)-dimethylallyltransferase MiaA [Candidatus Nomurabacteria bacterium]|jgi:tRNA dimethylallyltransferase|nr:tRNA (adenosine(37)-N6)-dimethylallyltransferase MiaA [Candidatus Nomurabacteria bacterium]
MSRKAELVNPRSKAPVVAIVGPTASGKTSLAIDLASQFNGEIISADSRAIYRYMDIGTAKPTPEEQARVKHWGIDLVEPGERFTVHDFKEYALGKIADIRARGKQPFVVGGTGLYVDALIYDYQFGKNYNDRLRVVPGYIVVGITMDRDELRNRIQKRADQMFGDSIVKETTCLAEKYGWGNEAMKSNIYPVVQEMIDGELTLEEAKQKIFFEDWHLARRQMTWFRRNKSIQWLTLEDAKRYISDTLVV